MKTRTQDAIMLGQLKSDTRVWLLISLALNVTGFYCLGSTVYPDALFNLSNHINHQYVPDFSINYASLVFALVGGRIDIAKGLVAQHITIVKSKGGSTFKLRVIGYFLTTLSIISTASIGYIILDAQSRVMLDNNLGVYTQQIDALEATKATKAASIADLDAELTDARATAGSAFKNKRTKAKAALTKEIEGINAQIAELSNTVLKVKNEFKPQLLVDYHGYTILAIPVTAFLIVGFFLELSINTYVTSSTVVKLGINDTQDSTINKGNHSAQNSTIDDAIKITINDEVGTINDAQNDAQNDANYSSAESACNKASEGTINSTITGTINSTTKQGRASKRSTIKGTTKSSKKRVNYSSLIDVIIAANDSAMSYAKMGDKYNLYPYQVKKVKEMLQAKMDNRKVADAKPQTQIEASALQLVK